MKLNTLTNDQLFEHLVSEAALFGITVEAHDGVELVSPTGKCFDEGLHSLVFAPWDNDTYRTCLFLAIKDLENCGSRMQDCPEDCDCKE